VNRETLPWAVLLAAAIAAHVWIRHANRAELERTLARVDEWIDDRRYLDEARRDLNS
jgi:hypothetical protein